MSECVRAMHMRVSGADRRASQLAPSALSRWLCQEEVGRERSSLVGLAPHLSAARNLRQIFYHRSVV